MSRERLEVRISGRVQGVWFRASTREEARRRGLDGWVRNLPDGSVEAVFEGQAPALESMLAWCRVGPPGARVDAVEVTRGPATGEHDGFTIVR
ncbi:MAG TPA: acylphosphatase [bacterium]